MTYEDLIIEAENHGLSVMEKQFSSSAKGMCKGKRIAIRKEMTSSQKACALAEELAHYHLTVGNILDQSDIGNRKQELKARRWAYEKLCPIENIHFLQPRLSNFRAIFMPGRRKWCNDKKK